MRIKTTFGPLVLVLSFILSSCSESEIGPGPEPEAMAEARRQELLVEATQTLHQDPVVQQLVGRFGGRLDEDSVTPKETVE